MPDHPKTIKLMRRCGDKAFYHLVKLICWVGINRPEGILTGMNDEDIEIASGWDGGPDFLEALIDLKWIDKNDEGVLSVHDWEEHNGWACGARLRSDKARAAARSRWEKHIKCSSNAQAMRKRSVSNAPSPNPSPSPNPKHKERKRARGWPDDFELTDEMRKYAIANRIDPDKVDKFFEDFRNWASASGATYKDWQAAFKTRVSKAPEYGKQFMAVTGGDDARFSNLR